MENQRIKEFVESLKNPTILKTDKNFNNPWENTTNCQNLLKFLSEYQNSKYILIGEAPGRKGCLQCGVPFCDDYTLEKLIYVSKDKKTKETSAQRIYEAFKYNFIAWNAFPYQPCNVDGSNRTPTSAELKFGKEYLIKFLDIFYNENKQIILLGNKAEVAFGNLAYKHKKVLHPSCQVDKMRLERGMAGWLSYIKNEIKDL